jgi:hypothetical protein
MGLDTIRVLESHQQSSGGTLRLVTQSRSAPLLISDRATQYLASPFGEAGRSSWPDRDHEFCGRFIYLAVHGCRRELMLFGVDVILNQADFPEGKVWQRVFNPEMAEDIGFDLTPKRKIGGTDSWHYAPRTTYSATVGGNRLAGVAELNQDSALQPGLDQILYEGPTGRNRIICCLPTIRKYKSGSKSS